ncbi:MAG: hypothetical protein HRF43_06015 [Phycisphaerae bacterium]|jgi:hypothetical protein
MFQINVNPTPGEVHRTGWVLLAGFGVIGLILWRAGGLPETGWGWAGTVRQVLALACWGLGLAGGGTCLAAPRAGRRVFVAWMTLAAGMGWVMTHLLLTLLFFLFLPFFLFIRAKDPLRRRPERRESYWEPHRPHEPTLDRMARPF